MSDLQSELLAVITRADRVESEHFGHIAVCDEHGNLVKSWGNPEAYFYLRSAAKPFQALTLVEMGVADQYGWTDEELTLVCASHFSSKEHLKHVESILAKANLKPDDLGCGPHAPLDNELRHELIRESKMFDKMHNNCSGKHSGMISGCKFNGWPIETYLDPDHPLQLANAKVMADWISTEKQPFGFEDLKCGRDGCGVPTWWVNSRQTATAFAKFAACYQNKTNNSVVRIGTAIATNPVLIGGKDTFNTVLHEVMGERVISKCGAEGVYAAALPDLGLGVALKISDGNNRVWDVVFCRILDLLEANFPTERVLDRCPPVIKNTLDWEVGTILSSFE